MSEWFGQMLGFVAAALGIIAVPDAAALGVAAVVSLGLRIGHGHPGARGPGPG